jgi:hypothetical protein
MNHRIPKIIIFLCFTGWLLILSACNGNGGNEHKSESGVNHNGPNAIIDVITVEREEPEKCGGCGEPENGCVCEPEPVPCDICHGFPCERPERFIISGLPVEVAGIHNIPSVVQDFNPDEWNLNTDWIRGPIGPDNNGRWVVSNWVGGFDNLMSRVNFGIVETLPGYEGSGFMSLRTAAVNNLSTSGIPANIRQELNGAEMFSPDWNFPHDHEFAYGYGYFEVRMKVAESTGEEFAANRGVCASFFLQSGRDDPGDLPGDAIFEIDFEFLTNGTVGDRSRENWVNSAGCGEYGYVATVLHPGNTVEYIRLDFNPSKGFYTYGILWLPDKIQWFVEGELVRTEYGQFERESVKIGMNNWTGSRHWGGLPPLDSDAVTYYDFVKYYPFLH